LRKERDISYGRGREGSEAAHSFAGKDYEAFRRPQETKSVSFYL